MEAIPAARLYHAVDRDLSPPKHTHMHTHTRGIDSTACAYLTRVVLKAVIVGSHRFIPSILS